MKRIKESSTDDPVYIFPGEEKRETSLRRKNWPYPKAVHKLVLISSAIINCCFVRFEVFTADFWDIKTQFVLHRRHISATEPSRLNLCKI
jgi:hypothetical protein